MFLEINMVDGIRSYIRSEDVIRIIEDVEDGYAGIIYAPDKEKEEIQLIIVRDTYEDLKEKVQPDWRGLSSFQLQNSSIESELVRTAKEMIASKHYKPDN